MPDHGQFNRSIDRQLADIASLLKKGEPSPVITVRTLLSWADALRRTYWVVFGINEALSLAGLRTNPHFENTYLDGPIAFQLADSNPQGVSPENDARSTTNDSTIVASADVVAVSRTSDPTIRISRLPAANKPMISVKPDVSLREAVTHMLHYDFSQLPVMTSEREVKGIISWNSIGARLAIGTAGTNVRDLMDAHVEIDHDVSLFDAIPIIVKHQYVLVRGADNKITGIVTSSDLGLQFRLLAEPYLLLGEIENYLRQVIAAAEFTPEELAAARDPNDEARSIQSVADLSFGEYIRLLQEEGRWKKTSLKLDRVLFCDLLEAARRIRNNVMHFDPDGIAEIDLAMLRRLTTMFQRLGSIEGLHLRPLA